MSQSLRSQLFLSLMGNDSKLYAEQKSMGKIRDQVRIVILIEFFR
jgi:hypothetical protein